MTNDVETVTASQQEPVVIEEQLYCALSGRPIRHDEAYWAPPLITARQLVTTVITTLLHAPGTLGQVLLAEQPNVPYAKDMREELAARRSAEQLKLLIGLLVAVALIALPVLWLTLAR
ncbi:MAG: hypothetical protein DIU80_014030 [Chloroflexota bacterium]